MRVGRSADSPAPRRGPVPVGDGAGSPGATIWPRVRFLLSWVVAIGLVGVGLPQTFDISWHGLYQVLAAVHWPALVGLVALWCLGLFVHSFVLTTAAPSLSRRRALTLNVTGSAVANVVPLGSVAGVELNRRMMKAWGIGGRGFTRYTFLTNLWDIGSKLLLPIVAVLALTRAGEAVGTPLQVMALAAAVAFVVVAGSTAVLLLSPDYTAIVGRVVERALRAVLRLVGRDRDLDVVGTLLDIRRDCAALVATGWLRMSLGIAGYVTLQGILLGLCLDLTGGGNSWAEVLAGFAVERMLTIVPITPGGVGVADLGLVGVLLAAGGNPTGVAAGALLYRAVVFALEIPIGGGTLGLWLLGRRLAPQTPASPRPGLGHVHRIAHVTDVFLPRLGGIETHVDDLARHQRAGGLAADVLTPTPSDGGDLAWVRRMPLSQARQVIGEYDAAHVHISMLSPYSIGVARAAIAAGVPTLITVHSMWAGAGGVVRLTAIAPLRSAPVVWAAVSGPAAAVVRRSLSGADVAVLPNAIDVSAWRRGPAAADRAGRPGEPITLISVMRLMPRKHPMELLRIFERVRALTPDRDVRLVIVGDGPLRRRMERYLARRGLTGVVRLTGRIPRERVIDELRAAALYVAPAPKESFGIAALEARCGGLPVVAHRSSGVSEFIRDRVEGVLVGDDAEMTVALADLVLDADLRRRITDHNRGTVPPFDWDTALQRTDDLYRRAAVLAATQPVASGTMSVASAEA